MSHKLYKGGETPLVGDIVECKDNSSVTGMLVYGKQYTVKGVTENSCVQVVYGQGGFYADRFRLIRRKEFVLQNHFYQGGEQSEEGDVIECVYDGEQSTGALVTLGKQYVVKSSAPNNLVHLVDNGGGFFQSRFKLIKRATNPHIITTELDQQDAPVVHEGPEQIMEIKESPMWRQKAVIRASQMLLISGIVVFWGRAHGVTMPEAMDISSFWDGWGPGVWNANKHQGFGFIVGVLSRVLYEGLFIVVSVCGVLWACVALPTEINHYFFGGKN